MLKQLFLAITDTPAVQATRANFSRAFDDAQKGIIGAQVKKYALFISIIYIEYVYIVRDFSIL